MGSIADSNISSQILTGVSKGHCRFMAYKALRPLSPSSLTVGLKFPVELPFVGLLDNSVMSLLCG